MNQQLGQLSLLVKDYDEAIHYYTQTLGFELLEDTPMTETKRWVRVAPKGSASQVGCQAGGRVFLFLYTDDFWRDYENYRARGVLFIREPAEEPYGIVSVFSDLYGNLWDLIQPKDS
jgi:catechol 2,3-dioxygenase-like lactoylglutathione lyase family enzyme